MAQATYYFHLVDAVTVFSGFTTSDATPPCGLPSAVESGYGAQYIYDTGTGAMCGGGTDYRFDASSQTGPGWVYAAINHSYPAATIITGVSAQQVQRYSTVQRMYFEAYTSGGSLDSTSTGYSQLTHTTTGHYTISMTGMTVTVPAGGWLVVRHDIVSSGGSARWYIGTSARSSGMSGQIIIDETAATTGPTGDGAADFGAMPVGTASGTVEPTTILSE